jgi:hypothetical protein
MAAGLPVVASDWDGYKDLVVHNKTGFLVPTYWMKLNTDFVSLYGILGRWQKDHLYLAQSVALDIAKLKRYLLMLVDNHALRKKMGEEGRRRVLAKFDWKVVIPQYEKLWFKLYRLSRKHTADRQGWPIFLPDYFYAFKHYPGRILDAKTKLGITKEGLEVLNSKKLSCSIDSRTISFTSMRIIFAVLSCFCNNDSLMVSEIERHSAVFTKSGSTGAIRHHIMWLLKKGMLKVSS